jgi:hypothetical protein
MPEAAAGSSGKSFLQRARDKVLRWLRRSLRTTHQVNDTYPESSLFRDTRLSRLIGLILPEMTSLSQDISSQSKPCSPKRKDKLATMIPITPSVRSEQSSGYPKFPSAVSKIDNPHR